MYQADIRPAIVLILANRREMCNKDKQKQDGLMDNVQDYLSHGGKIEICNPMETKDKLVQERADKKKARKKQKKQDKKAGIKPTLKPPDHPHDEICTLSECLNIKVCLVPCPAIVWIDGNASAKEKILDDPLNDRLEYKDYKPAIYDRQKHYEYKMERIREIPDKRLRAIAAMISVGLLKQDIADLLNISDRHFRRILTSADK